MDEREQNKDADGDHEHAGRDVLHREGRYDRQHDAGQYQNQRYADHQRVVRALFHVVNIAEVA